MYGIVAEASEGVHWHCHLLNAISWTCSQLLQRIVIYLLMIAIIALLHVKCLSEVAAATFCAVAVLRLCLSNVNNANR